jgi:tubulin monoglycylase TTLL3/8
MRNYYESAGIDAFSYLPLTFLITEGSNDPEFTRFRQYFSENESEIGQNKQKNHNLWIIKPGENTNCGHGIHVSSTLSEIESLITSSAANRSHIVQKYLEKPLLVHKRKFDIRCYGLCTSFNGHIQGYFYQDGYLRTSSKEFSLRNVGNRFIHLTNDAVQKKSEDYGKFESGNKMSYAEFQRYLETHFPGKVSFWEDIWPQIRKLVTNSYRATSNLLDPKHRQHCFEVLGYDFMIDEDFHVWLIEVNTNPCLELSSAYLAGLIPAMLDNAFRIAVDPYFTEPIGKKQTQWSTQVFQNRFELVFSSTQKLVSATPEPGLIENSYASEGEEA